MADDKRIGSRPVPVSRVGLPWRWGPGRALVGKRFDCDDDVPSGGVRLTRSVLVQADAETTWLWLCQLRRAPYSYDFIDNLGRRSPSVADPRMTHLRIGDRFMTIFTIASFEDGSSITIRGHQGQLFGDVYVTYQIEPIRADLCLLHGIMPVPPASATVQRLANGALAWGDLVMMRKQLRTLARLAERDFYTAHELEGEVRIGDHS